MDTPSGGGGIFNCRPGPRNRSVRMFVIRSAFYNSEKQTPELFDNLIFGTPELKGGDYLKIKSHVRGGPKAR